MQWYDPLDPNTEYEGRYSENLYVDRGRIGPTTADCCNGPAAPAKETYTSNYMRPLSGACSAVRETYSPRCTCEACSTGCGCSTCSEERRLHMSKLKASKAPDRRESYRVGQQRDRAPDPTPLLLATGDIRPEPAPEGGLLPAMLRPFYAGNKAAFSPAVGNAPPSDGAMMFVLWLLLVVLVSACVNYAMMEWREMRNATTNLRINSGTGLTS